MTTDSSALIGFIGAGNMASALITGLLNAGRDKQNLLAIDPSAEQRTLLEARFGVRCFDHIEPAVARTVDIWVLATKPQQLAAVATELGTVLAQSGSTPLIISIAAGIRLTDLQRWLGGATRLVRTMPNTPALIAQGITGMFANPHCSEGDRASAQAILQACGQVVWVDQESDLDAVTALSGSGPAYVFYFIEALQAAGEELGLPAEQSRQLAIATFTGAAALASQSDESLALLRERVTSKGGTTYAALEQLRAREVAGAIRSAAAAAAQRATELGDEFGQSA